MIKHLSAYLTRLISLLPIIARWRIDLLFCSLLSCGVWADEFAMITDQSNAVINVNANQIEVDSNNIIVYSGSVIIHLGSRTLIADVVRVFQNDGNINRLEAHTDRAGSLVTFQQGNPQDEDYLFIRAQKAIYHYQQELLQLSDYVYFSSPKISIESEMVEYDLLNKRLLSTGNHTKKTKSLIKF